MERKFLLVVAFVIATFAFTSCEYDDNALWSEMESVKDRITALEEAASKTNSDIVALQAIVNALQENVYVTEVTATDQGYTITFSDGNTATISNGKDGANAPVVSVKEDEDGNYYWTLDGEWLLVGENKVRANGQDAVAPQVRINEETKEWEISTDGGKSWVSTQVVAEGKTDENAALFKSISTSNADYVVFTLADGTNIKLARYDESVPMFVIKGAPAVATIGYGKSEKFDVTAINIADYVINTPEGWQASYAKEVLTITAPAKSLCHYDEQGTVAITVVSDSGKSAIVKLDVAVKDSYELRVLTFEDKDVKFSPYSFADCQGTSYSISSWSDLIPALDYGDYMIYDPTYMGGDSGYNWSDSDNTNLSHAFPATSRGKTYNASGHVLSKSYTRDYNTYGAYNYELYVYADGAHSGTNCCVHHGYKDSGRDLTLPSIEFEDGVARVIDHMWVANTSYAYNNLYKGHSFGSSYQNGATDDSWFKIVAYGYKKASDTTPTTEVEFYLLAKGKKFVTDWTKWDLSELGAVEKVEFNILGSDDMISQWGLGSPAYFAYDDVAVRFE